MPTFPATSQSSGITNGYATLADLKARLSIASAVTTYDATLEGFIETASRRIDEDTEREFFTTSATRYYTPDDHLTLFSPDDIQSISVLQTVSVQGHGLRTYGYTWTEGQDFDLEPANKAPYTRVVVNSTGIYTFPLLRRGVKITGVFGYCTAGNHPPMIGEACLIMAARMFERVKSPLGVIGGEQLTESVRIGKADPDYEALIAPYIRMELGALVRW